MTNAQPTQPKSFDRFRDGLWWLPDPEQPGWFTTPTPGECYAKIKILTEALETVQSEMLLTGQLAELVDEALAYDR